MGAAAMALCAPGLLRWPRGAARPSREARAPAASQVPAFCPGRAPPPAGAVAAARRLAPRPRVSRRGAVAAAAAAPPSAAGARPRPPRGSRAPPECKDPVFQWLEQRLPTDGWGDVLDAGTGPDSLNWLAAGPAGSITAVTACEDMLETVQEEVSECLDPSVDRLVIGNWENPDMLKGREFDLVLADYLLGSVDHFAPHFQVGLIRRLRGLLRPGGVLALLGKEPEDHAAASLDAVASLVLDVEALRDAAMVLRWERPYREMPLAWVRDQLQGCGLRVEVEKEFPRRLNVEKVFRAIEWAEHEVDQVEQRAVRAGLEQRLGELRARAEGPQVSRALERGHAFGVDYALLARRPAAAA